MTHLETAVKYKLQFAWERCHNITKVARDLKLNPKTVRRWVSRFETTGKMDIKPGRGRKPRLDESAASLAGDLLLSGKFANATEVAAELHKLGKSKGGSPVNRTTLTRHAKAFAKARGEPIQPDTSKPVKMLSAQNIQARLDFCEVNKTRAWGAVMFTDRKKFHFTYPGSAVHRVGWVKKGERRQATKVSNPMAVNLYAGITKYGVTKPHIVAGTSKTATNFKTKKGQPARNITAAEYKQVVSQTLLPEGKRLFQAAGHSSFWLQQDNDPCHAKAAQEAIAEWNQLNPGFQVYLLPNWPANSPDLNPIENLWAWIDRNANASGCNFFAQYKTCVLDTLKTVPQEMVARLVRSMKDRVYDCIAVGGEKTSY